MFDIGWTEMLMIIVVMIIVIGPKDLPRAMRATGQFIGRMRAYARYFQQSIEQMAEESGIEDARRELEKATRVDVNKTIERTIDPKGELREGLTLEPPAEAPDAPRDGGPGTGKPPEAAPGAAPDAAPDAGAERKP